MNMKEDTGIWTQILEGLATVWTFAIGGIFAILGWFQSRIASLNRRLNEMEIRMAVSDEQIRSIKEDLNEIKEGQKQILKYLTHK